MCLPAGTGQPTRSRGPSGSQNGRLVLYVDEEHGRPANQADADGAGAGQRKVRAGRAGGRGPVSAAEGTKWLRWGHFKRWRETELGDRWQKGTFCHRWQRTTRVQNPRSVTLGLRLRRTRKTPPEGADGVQRGHGSRGHHGTGLQVDSGDTERRAKAQAGDTGP